MHANNDEQHRAQFHRMLQENIGRLQRVARSYAAEGESEDLLQDMLMQIWRSLPGFDGRSKVSTWIYRIALNTAMGKLRQRYARPPHLAMSHEQLLPLMPHSVGDPVDADQLLDHVLVSLEPVDRAVLMLSLDDLSHADIAAVTGLSRNAVGIRLFRMKQRLEQDHVENRG